MTDTNTTVQNSESEVTFKRDYAPHRRCSIRICVDCGRSYVISDSDIKYFIEKYGQIPLRCPACRERRREQNTTEPTSEN